MSMRMNMYAAEFHAAVYLNFFEASGLHPLDLEPHEEELGKVSVLVRLPDGIDMKALDWPAWQVETAMLDGACRLGRMLAVYEATGGNYDFTDRGYTPRPEELPAGLRLDTQPPPAP